MIAYMARGIEPDSWLNDDRYAEFRSAYDYASGRTRAIPGLSKISAEEAYWVWLIIQRGIERQHRLTSNDPEPDIGTTVVDATGVRWKHVPGVHVGVDYWLREDSPDGDAESWYHVAGNYGPVRLVDTPKDPT